MDNIFRTELKRAFINPRFMLVFILAGISFAYGFFQIHPMQSQSPVGALTAWQEILSAGYYGFFAAITAGLPFADSLSKDKSEHLLDPILTRTSYARYLRAKSLAVALSGAAAVLLPAGLMLGICYLIYPAEPVHRMGLYFSGTEIYTRTLVQPGFYLNPSIGMYAALALLFLQIFGAVYALLGMGISFLTRKSMFVLGLPFIFYSFGFYFIPTSRHLNWMISTQTVLVPQGNLISPLLQIGLIGIFFLIIHRGFGKKETQVLQ
jgi:hypothetical protein